MLPAAKNFSETWLGRWQARLWLALVLGCAFAAQGQKLETRAEATLSALDPSWAVGSWIWTDRTFDKQTCLLWRAFDIPAGAAVIKAQLRITADNGFRLMLDGREIGRGYDWRWLSDFDLSWLLPPGRHVLAVEAFNDALKAGVLAGLRVQLQGGEIIEVGSDETWRIVPEGERGWERRKKARPSWPAALLAGKFRTEPWSASPVGVTPVAPLHPVVLRFWQTGWFQIASLSLCALAVLLSLRLLAKLALQAKAQGLLRRERLRIARDIHDDLGAGLTQLVLLGELAQNELPAGSERRVQMEELCDKTRALLGAMDEIVWAVNSRRDTVRDFATHACKYAQMFLASTAIRCRLHIEADLPEDEFDLPARRNLFLGVKEAINNCAKHSAATELVLRIHRRGGALDVTVEDNGIGFELPSANGDRNGISNMNQRMKEVGGECRIASVPGGGCRIRFLVPLLSPRRKPVLWPRWLRLRKGILKAHIQEPIAEPQPPAPRCT